jgi:hypothetical protein
MRFFYLFLAISMCACGALAANDGVALSDVVEKALKQSKLTNPGNKAFHLTAKIIETTNPDSKNHASIEEYWVSPTKWRRTIVSPEFSQTLIVNGDSSSEQDIGDYFPLWIKNMVTAIFDPLPMAESLKQSKSQIARPSGAEQDSSCANFPFRVDRWVICFEGGRGLLSSVFTKGYEAEFKDYKKFGDQRVAHRIVVDVDRDLKLQAEITSLTELSQPDEKMFDVAQVAPQSERIKSVTIPEDTFRKLVHGNTEIAWPPTGGGPATGGCAVYASADRTGRVREVWPEGCDNAGLQGPLQEIVKNWVLTPAVANGVPVQVEALMGFAFKTAVDNSHPLAELSNSEARKLATNVIEAVLATEATQHVTKFEVGITVDESGKLLGVHNSHNLSNEVFLAANKALSQWRFKPYSKDGKAQAFNANIVFELR